jgi:hypothetical protein
MEAVVMPRRMFRPFPHERPQLDALLKLAVQHVMTPEEKETQRRSWSIGELMLSHPDMTREEAIEIYASVTGGTNAV